MFLFGSFFGYPFWEKMAGTPSQRAALLQQDPAAALSHAARLLEEPSGKSVAVISDACGITAVALALLGAQVTLFSVSEGNERYATELAEAAEVRMPCVVCPPEEIDRNAYAGRFDAVIVDGAVLHFTQALRPAVRSLHDILKPGGQLISGVYPFDGNLAKIMLFSQPGLLNPDEADYMKAQIAGVGAMPLGLLHKQDQLAIITVGSDEFLDCKFRTAQELGFDPSDETYDGANFILCTKA